MRNLNRIQEIMQLIKVIWEKYPDMRFNQLVYALQGMYAQSNGIEDRLWNKEQHRGIVEYQRTVFVDLFNTEDDSFLAFLKDKVAETNGEQA